MKMPVLKSDRKHELMLSGDLYVCHGSKDTPAPPDYQAAAEATAQGNLEMLQAQTEANRPNQFTPFGSSTWSQNGDKWTQTTRLNPESQRALSSQLRLMGDRSELGGSLMGRAQDEFGSPMDWSSLPDWGATPDAGDVRNRAEDALYGRATSRLDPEWDQRQQKLQDTMVARGLRPGDPAWQQEMDNFERARTDAYDTARYGAIAGGGDEATRQFNMSLQGSGYANTMRQAQLAEEMQRRGFSLNEINALISGQQVGMPQMPSFSMAGRVAGPDYMGAATNQYQGALDAYSAKNAATQGIMTGIGDLAFGFG